MDEWHIGDPVDWGDGWMDAQNWGHGGDDENDEDCSGSYRSYGDYGQSIDPDQANMNRLKYKKDSYERKLKEAREAINDEYRIRYYGEALKLAEEYFEESEKWGITVDGMPDRNHVLSKEDVDWISKKHYDECFKFHILSTDQTEDLENLLRQSGNGGRIKRNEETHRQISIENAKRRAANHIKYLNEEYFKHIEKANELVMKGKFAKAMKEYQKAVSAYDEFVKSDNVSVKIVREMPEKSLTPEAVDHIMIIYKKTHPLLTSRKKDGEINKEILDMLGGDWNDRLGEADREVQEIFHQKQLERQKRKEKVQEIGVDAIVTARIVGDKILRRLRK